MFRRGDDLIGDINKSTAQVQHPHLGVYVCVWLFLWKRHISLFTRTCAYKALLNSACMQMHFCMCTQARTGNIHTLTKVAHKKNTHMLKHHPAFKHAHKQTHTRPLSRADDQFHHDRSTEHPLCLTIEWEMTALVQIFQSFSEDPEKVTAPWTNLLYWTMMAFDFLRSSVVGWTALVVNLTQ